MTKEISYHLKDKVELDKFLNRLREKGFHVFKQNNTQASRMIPNSNKRIHVIIQEGVRGGYDMTAHIDATRQGFHNVVEDDRLLVKVVECLGDIFGYKRG